MTDQDYTQDAPACACGRACSRGNYGFLNTHCGRPECETDAPARRKRKRLTVHSEKTLDKDFQLIRRFGRTQ